MRKALFIILILTASVGLAITWQKAFFDVIDIRDTLTTIDTVIVDNLDMAQYLPGGQRPDYFVLIGKMQDAWDVDSATNDTTWLDTVYAPTNTCSLRVDAMVGGDYYIDIEDTFLISDRPWGNVYFTFRNNYYEKLRFIITGNSGWTKIKMSYVKDLHF
jgi:hypothetical protein